MINSFLSVYYHMIFQSYILLHTGDFPRGMGHKVENEWVLTKVAVVLLNGLIW